MHCSKCICVQGLHVLCEQILFSKANVWENLVPESQPWPKASLSMTKIIFVPLFIACGRTSVEQWQLIKVTMSMATDCFWGDHCAHSKMMLFISVWKHWNYLESTTFWLLYDWREALNKYFLAIIEIHNNVLVRSVEFNYTQTAGLHIQQKNLSGCNINILY